MKVERPVIYTQTVCDVCKRDIKDAESYYTLKQITREVFIIANEDLDICQQCFEKTGVASKPKKIESFALSASYAITASYIPNPLWKLS